MPSPAQALLPRGEHPCKTTRGARRALFSASTGRDNPCHQNPPRRRRNGFLGRERSHTAKPPHSSSSVAQLTGMCVSTKHEVKVSFISC